AAYGFYGNRLLVAGPEQAFCTSLQQFDDYALGSAAGTSDLPPLCLELVDFDGRYLDNGQAAHFSAETRYTLDDSKPRDFTLRVNGPLRLEDGSVYLVGHGYAPVIRYTDRYGRGQTSVAPFLPRDEMLSSEGAAVFPDANVNPKTGKRDPGLQMGFQGLYLPTLPENPRSGHSAFPTERDPGLVLFAYRGDLGMDAGIPRSVYSLDQRQIDRGRLTMIGEQPKLLRPGEKWTLDDGTTVEFLGTRQWITLQLRHDPGAPVVLVAGGVLLAGLLASLTVRRRRVWFRLTVPVGTDDQPGRTIVTAGGLTRAEYSGFGDEFARLMAKCLPDAVPLAVPLAVPPSGAKGD
ncbi:MAG TPA: cytochrome c biogenesis protein ResB, partial [Micromonosporaceae bacterium]|nr:cytochrome c biogenesis protein ResB [Micromonosporaceae bacterium]